MNPIDQMSVLLVYFLLSRICGLMYKGVPTNEDNISFLKLSTHLANPKSASLNTCQWLESKYPLIYEDVGRFQIAMDDTILDQLNETSQDVGQEF